MADEKSEGNSSNKKESDEPKKKDEKDKKSSGSNFGSKIWGASKSVGSGIGRGVSGISKGAVGIATKGPGSIIRAGVSPVRIFIRLIVWVISAILFVILFTFFALLVSSLIYKGEVPERISIILDTFHIKEPVLSFLSSMYSISTLQPVEQGEYGFSGTTTTTEEKIGINILSFEPRVKIVKMNQPVLATAQIGVSKTPEKKDVLLEFENTCYLQDYTDLEQPKQSTSIPNEQLILSGQDGFRFMVRCEFPDGFDVLEPVIDPNKRISVTKTSDLKELRFSPRFAFSQEIAWKPFTKDMYEIGDSIMTPTWDLSNGPASLRLGSDESQPFYIGDPHELYVYVSTNWAGNIKEVSNVQLEVPDNIELLTDDSFCDFERVGRGYRIKSPKIQETKVDCTSKDVLKTITKELPKWKGYAGKETELTFDDCIKTYKTEFKFSCPFIVTDAEKVASKTQISAKANYLYEMQATSSLTLVKPQEELVA